MGDLGFNYMLEHIKMTEENWSKVRELSKETQLETVNWVKENLYKKIIELPTEIPETVDIHFANLLYYNLRDYDMISDEYFSKRIKDILYNIQEPLYKNVPTIKSKMIKNSVLNYKLGDRISLIETVQKLLNTGLYRSDFHNAISRKAKANIPIEIIEKMTDIDDSNIYTPSTREEFSPNSTEPDEDDDYEDEEEDDDDDENKEKFHKFTISQSSSITQTSPTNYTQAIKAYRRLCHDLGFEALL